MMPGATGFQKLSTDVIDPYPTILLYGGPGVGKTVLAGGSQYLRTLFYDIDKGMDSLASIKTDDRLAMYGYPPIQRHLIERERVDTYKDFENGLTKLERWQNSFDLVVVDTWSELLKIILQESRQKGSRVLATQQDWGIVLQSMEYLTRQFKNMRKISILLAHEAMLLDPNTGMNRIVPNFKGQYRTDYAQHFSLILRYFLVDQQFVDPGTQQIQTTTARYLNCWREPNIDTKDRSSSLDHYELPFLDNILGKYLSALQHQHNQQMASVPT